MAKYYLLDENKNLVEGFDKEGFLALLEQAIEQGSLENIDENSAVASKLRSVLNGTTHHIEFVTQAQYNQLVADEELVANTWYFITDDDTAESMEQIIIALQQQVEALQNTLNSSLCYQHDIRLFGTIDGKDLKLSLRINTGVEHATLETISEVIQAIWDYSGIYNIMASGSLGNEPIYQACALVTIPQIQFSTNVSGYRILEENITNFYVFTKKII